MKKLPFAQTTTLQTNLPPPPNLTSQEIMDLPIIFADDNQMLTANTTIPQQAAETPKQLHQSQTFKLSAATTPATTSSAGKIVLVNKHHVPFQGSAMGNIILSQPTLKRPSGSVPFRSQANSMKYSKIIISSKHAADEAKVVASNGNIMSKISALSPEISLKKIDTSKYCWFICTYRTSIHTFITKHIDVHIDLHTYCSRRNFSTGSR